MFAHNFAFVFAGNPLCLLLIIRFHFIIDLYDQLLIFLFTNHNYFLDSQFDLISFLGFNEFIFHILIACQFFFSQEELFRVQNLFLLLSNRFQATESILYIDFQ